MYQQSKLGISTFCEHLGQILEMTSPSQMSLTTTLHKLYLIISRSAVRPTFNHVISIQEDKIHFGKGEIKHYVCWQKGRYFPFSKVFQAVHSQPCDKVRKGKGFPLQAWYGFWGSRRLRLLDHLDIRHYEGGKVVTLTHRPPSPPGIFVVLIFRVWVDFRAHGSAGSFRKNPQRHHRGSIPRPSD
jgi:hypothetical protein